jgi:hypothetical protein
MEKLEETWPVGILGGVNVGVILSLWEFFAETDI